MSLTHYLMFCATSRQGHYKNMGFVVALAAAP
jgi:hypothetical protein